MNNILSNRFSFAPATIHTDEDHDNYELKIRKAPDVFKATMNPMVTTGSVIALKCSDGVIMACDCSGFYGRMAKFFDTDHVFKINDQIMIGLTGDYADFQYLKELIDQKVINDDCLADGFQLKPHSLHNWLTRILYNRRSKFDPLWMNLTVAGMDNGVPFLGLVDKLGMSFTDNCIATGLGGYLIVPYLRSFLEKNPNATVAEARPAIEKAVGILLMRDTSAKAMFQIGVVTAKDVQISPSFAPKMSWGIASYVSGYE